MASFQMNARPDGQTMILELQGEIDQSSVGVYKTRLLELMENEAAPLIQKFIFDCSGLSFINSEGIGQLMATQAKLVKKDKKMVLAGLQPNVKDVFELIGLTKIIPTFSDVASAKA